MAVVGGVPGPGSRALRPHSGRAGRADGRAAGVGAAVVAERAGPRAPAAPLQHARVEVGVAPRVLRQVVAAHEALLADRAAELLLARVRAVVPRQLVGARELLVTLLPAAGEGPLTCGDTGQGTASVPARPHARASGIPPPRPGPLPASLRPPSGPHLSPRASRPPHLSPSAPYFISALSCSKSSKAEVRRHTLLLHTLQGTQRTAPGCTGSGRSQAAVPQPEPLATIPTS